MCRVGPSTPVFNHKKPEFARICKKTRYPSDSRRASIPIRLGALCGDAFKPLTLPRIPISDFTRRANQVRRSSEHPREYAQQAERSSACQASNQFQSGVQRKPSAFSSNSQGYGRIKRVGIRVHRIESVLPAVFVHFERPSVQGLLHRYEHFP